MKKTFRYILMAVALVATASCSNEWDHASQPVAGGNLQFVVSDFPAFGENPQTRASSLGKPDAGKTAWENDDKILVELASDYYDLEVVELTYTNGEWTTSNDAKLYILEEEKEYIKITAVYAPGFDISEGYISQNLDKVLGEYEYILADTEIADNKLNISFANAVRTYSRLRIVAEAEQTLTVTTTGFTPAGVRETATEAYTLTADANGNAYLYGTFAENGTVTVKNGETELVTHNFTTATEANKSYVLYAGKKTEVNLETLTETYVIKDDGYYVFSGTGGQGIKVASGNPTIILNNATIKLGNDVFTDGINIASTSGTTTIRVIGENSITPYMGAGIFVAEGGTVNITSGSTNNILRIQGNDAAAIGGKYDTNNTQTSLNAGDINISGVTVYAYTSDCSAAAIGAAGDGTCGTVRITDAIVYAYGNGEDYSYTSAPGIGCGCDPMSMESGTPPVVIITDSEIHTFRFSQYSDYIGYVGGEYAEDYGYLGAGNIYCGEGGSVTNSTIYCYTGLEATTTDKVVTYDAEGNPTEQSE